MHNSEQVREFFRKMADGRALNSTSHSLLHASDSVAVERLDQEKPVIRVELPTVFNDFGVGLPPMAHV